MNRGFVNVALIIVIALVAIVAGAGWWYLSKSGTSPTTAVTELPTLPQSTNQNSGVKVQAVAPTQASQSAQQKPTSGQTNITVVATANNFTFELPQGWTSNTNAANPIQLMDQSGSVVATVVCPQKLPNWENRNTVNSQNRDFGSYRASYREMTGVDAPANDRSSVQYVDIYVAPIGWDPYGDKPGNECVVSSIDSGKILSSDVISGLKKVFSTWAVATDL